MVRGARSFLVSAVVLAVVGVLPGCSGWFFGEREPWRHDAEVACLNSGAVTEGPGKVRISAINGPGICGADFPIKVSTLGGSAMLGYGDEPRPPSGIPNVSAPRWPLTQPPPYEPRYDVAPPRGGPGYEGYDQMPMVLDPQSSPGAAGEPHDFRRGVRPPVSSKPLDPPYDLSPEPYDHRRVIGEPRSARDFPQRDVQPPPPAAGPVAVSPPATLACPLVSVLDQWIANSVQPAALRWFGQPVIEIKQISAYSCRGMNGNPNARISEHAFGNALDVAAFTLADGRKVTVKTGWNGSPQEQGFLRDVQGAACQEFNTVLAPGSNAYHYDHIHVDLMRRGGGRHACNPRAVSGEEVAARASTRLARRGEASVTGSVNTRPLPPRWTGSSAYSRERRNLPIALPGEDGEN